MPVHNSNCKPFTFDSLVSQLYSVTEKFPDKRTGNNIRYTIEDAALGAFSIFFTQNPSFIDGINWVKSNDNPILELGADGTWDDDGTDHPMVIKNGTTYKMWYAGYDDDSHGRIGYATNAHSLKLREIL